MRRTAASLRTAAEAACKRRDGQIRIRESLGRIRDPRRQPHRRPQKDCAEEIDGVVYSTGEDFPPPGKVDESRDAAFFDRYALTVSHHQKITEVSFEESDEDSVILPLPREEIKPVRFVNKATCGEIYSASLQESVPCDIDTRHELDSLQESLLTVPNTAEFDLNEVVDDLHDVLVDFTYFFRCLKDEANSQFDWLQNTPMVCTQRCLHPLP